MASSNAPKRRCTATVQQICEGFPEFIGRDWYRRRQLTPVLVLQIRCAIVTTAVHKTGLALHENKYMSVVQNLQGNAGSMRPAGILARQEVGLLSELRKVPQPFLTCICFPADSGERCAPPGRERSSLSRTVVAGQRAMEIAQAYFNGEKLIYALGAESEIESNLEACP